eukprot:2626215-Pyramimonas_sp.AAC.1
MQSVDASRRTCNADHGVGRKAVEDSYKREMTQSVDASRKTRNADRSVGHEAAEDTYKREASRCSPSMMQSVDDAVSR